MAVLETDGGMTMLVILVIGAFIGGIFLLRWLSAKATNGLNRAIHKGQHVAGQKAAGTSHLVTTSTSTPQQLITALWRAYPYPVGDRSESLLNSSVYKTGDPDEGGFQVAFGKKFIDQWTVIIGETDDGVGYVVNNVMMADGLVVGAKQLVELEQQFLRTVNRVDPGARVETDSEKVQWK